MSRGNNKDNDRTESMGDFDREPDRPRIEKLGHFKIEATLGSGGMGTIYRAYDESMKRPVALKVLHSSLEISERAQSRFVREAWIAGQLDHPNIIKVFSRGEENKVSYLALELAEGGSLSDLIEQTRESIPSGSDVTDTVDQDYIKAILAKFIELAGALEHIHSKGFIHRDIKPQNVLLSGADRKFKLTDFGIAHAKDMTRMTQAGDFIGTVRYMSPELLAAHRAGIDKRTDIYSLGVTLYEALTLTLPFKADSEEKLIGEILAGHCIEARKANRRIPVDLETVLMKACNHDPDLRYQTAEEFADDLQRIIDGRPVLARRQGVVSKGVKYIRRNYKAVLAIAASLIIVLGGFLWQYYRLERGQDDSGIVIIKREVSGKPDFRKVSIPTKPYLGALSPDGKSIAYPSQGCIWIAPMRGKADPNVAGAPVKLTQDVGARNTGDHLCWSGDGEWIAFNGHPGRVQGRLDWTTALYVVRSSGGEPKKIPVEVDWGWYAANGRISLSPDGSILAFTSYDLELPVSKTRWPSECCVYTIPVAGGTARRVAESGTGQPAFSPDGRKIAYVKGKYSLGRWVQNVWVTDVSGSPPVRISDFSFSEVGSGWWQMDFIGAAGPAWSPDGDMIAFEYWSGDIHGNPEIRIARLSPNGKVDGVPLRIELPYASSPSLAGWTSDNQIGLFFYPGGEAIYTVPASGGNATQIAPRSYCTSPIWSTDGQSIFFNYRRMACLIPADGGDISEIPITTSEPIELDWGPSIALSPDGEQIAFAGRSRGEGSYNIWVAPAQGGSVRQLTTSNGFSDFDPCWSPDGKLIAFARWRDNSDDDELGHIFTIPASGGELRQLTSDSNHVASFSGVEFSPDGEFIAYASGDTTLRIISVRSKESRIVLKADDRALYHRENRFTGINDVTWSPDGQSLAFTTKGQVWIVGREGGQPQKVMTGLDADIFHVSWSPDGRILALGAEEYPDPEFWLMDNFLPLAKSTEEDQSAEPTFVTIKVPGLPDYCALSPDGSKLAFVADDSCLWVAPTHGTADPTVAGEPVRLTEPMVRRTRSSYPVWSADGQWIAFNARGKRDSTSDNSLRERVSMFVIPSTGGQLTQIPVKQMRHCVLFGCSRYDLRISLSPNGKSIAFSTDSSLTPGESKTGCIYTTHVAGGEVKQLTDAQCGQPAYSPDGRMLAYVKGDQSPWATRGSGKSDIWVVPVGGGAPTQVTDLPGEVFGPVWSPDSRKIAFARWSEDTDINDNYVFQELSLVTLSDTYQPLGPPAVVKLPHYSIDFIGGWSTDNEIGLVLTTDVEGAIYTIPASGGIATQITPFHAYSPSWSPDGKKMFFLTETAVYSMPAEGGEASIVPITGMKAVSYANCDVSPDGTRLAFAGIKEGDSRVGVFTVSVDGGKPSQLVSDSVGALQPCWSPDGNWIAFTRGSSSDTSSSWLYHLCVVPAEGGEVRQLVAPPERDSCGYFDGQVGWSPDGKLIAYPSFHIGSRDSMSGISIVPFEGGDPELVVEFEPDFVSFSVSWSPDGKKLAYCSYDWHSGRDANLWILPLDTRKPVKLRTGLDLENVWMVDWSPDGEKIAFTSHGPSRRDFWLVKNFLRDELTQR